MEEKTETENGSKKTKKPKWMRVLEKQSWQAELVISGVAIFGSLQLPSALQDFIDFCIYYVSDEMMGLVYIFILYLGLIIPVLIINFILHFILRALWIGMLGLSNSI